MINQIFVTLLNFFAQYLFNSYALAIIAVTSLIRIVLIPFTLPTLKSQKKIQSLKPEIDKLKSKYSSDKKTLQQKQLELYQQHNINPAAGCLPQLIQIGLFIVFYRVLINSLNSDNISYSLNFFWLNLTQPDETYILPALAGISQLILALMIKPGADTKAEHQLAAKTKTKKDDKQADDMEQMAQTMQSQMVFLMPAMTFFLARSFPSGLALYWITSTIISIVQQFFVSGLGGLSPTISRAYSIFKKE